MKVENKIRPFHINVEERKVGDERFLYVRNVWNCNRLIELQFNDETVVTVKSDELIKAISNATNNEF